LNLPEGTVNSRLSRGRTLLSARLARCGVALSTGGVALVLAQCAAASVPVRVATSTVRLALLTSGSAGPASVVPPEIAVLTHGIGAPMLATKFKLVTAAAILLSALGITSALALGRTGGPAPAPAPGAPPMKADKEARPDLIRGAVKAIDGDLITLVGGARALLTPQTEYLRETGDDAAPAKRSDLTPGTLVYISTKTQANEPVPVAVVVVIELIQPPKPAVVRDQKDEPKLAGDPNAVMKAMDGFRKSVPEPQGLQEKMGAGIEDINGKLYLDTHLIGVAARMGVKTRAECMVLLSYLKDPDPKIRRIAAFGLECAVKVHPKGMAHDDMHEVESDGHRKMVKAFIAGIEKLPK
jgi:hypothetical protein